MHKLVVPFICCFFVMCSKDHLAGTVTDTNSGSITGFVLNNNEVFKDSITLSLFLNDTVVKQAVFSRGEYSFDSLQAGTYSIGVFKDSILIGKEQLIKLNTNEKKTINIQVVIIINQIFNIVNINNIDNVIINKFYIVGTSGTLDSLGCGTYKVSFTEKDTVNLKLFVSSIITEDTLSVTFVKQSDGTYSSISTTQNTPFTIIDGVTVRNAGNGSDSSTVRVFGKIQEEGL